MVHGMVMGFCCDGLGGRSVDCDSGQLAIREGKTRVLRCLEQCIDIWRDSGDQLLNTPIHNP